MTRDEALTLFSYDSWANDHMFEAVSRIGRDALHEDRGSSHRSIFGTLLHIVAAEEVWLSRWNKRPLAKLTGVDDVPTLDSLRLFWDSVREARDRFVGGLADDVGGDVTITTTEGDRYRHSFADMFRHLVNHSSYHRGQVAAMLRQIGEAPPATDLIRFYRERSTQSSTQAR
ncbi:MAG TPA: DinB family protein [Vicinamibacteria bacterium]|nr:DinB family protein [Vicinamibacteria bacterium]